MCIRDRFRPLSWVSGDLYDVFRLDETHIGFYVADVVGHGLPAALLTMFIKKALQTKRIEGHSYHIIPPNEVLEQLNADMCQQNFTSCQFCTAFYAIVDTDSLRLRYARAGHPSPVLLDRHGQPRRLQADGRLLGAFPGETFPAEQVQLSPGNRLVTFSDGIEGILSASPGEPREQALVEEMLRLSHLLPEEMVQQLTGRIDDRRVEVRADDITLLVMEVAG